MKKPSYLRRPLPILEGIVVIGLLLALALIFGPLYHTADPISDEAATGTRPCTATDLRRVGNGKGAIAVVRTAVCYSFESVWYYVVLVHTGQESNGSESVAFMYQPEDLADLGRGPSRPKVVWTGASSMDIVVSGPIGSPNLQRKEINGISIRYALSTVLP